MKGPARLHGPRGTQDVNKTLKKDGGKWWYRYCYANVSNTCVATLSWHLPSFKANPCIKLLSHNSRVDAGGLNRTLETDGTKSWLTTHSQHSLSPPPNHTPLNSCSYIHLLLSTTPSPRERTHSRSILQEGHAHIHTYTRTEIFQTHTQTHTHNTHARAHTHTHTYTHATHTRTRTHHLYHKIDRLYKWMNIANITVTHACA
jgi:hypothetical protein